MNGIASGGTGCQLPFTPSCPPDEIGGEQGQTISAQAGRRYEGFRPRGWLALFS
jgi:hypothetical protein